MRALSFHRIATSLLACACAASLAGEGLAYQINPLKNKYHGNRPRGGVWEQIAETVHEDITDAARHCAERSLRATTATGGAVTCTAEDETHPRHAIGNKYDPLIRGVWWNDDPNQHIFGVHYTTWAIWMHDAQGIAVKGRNWLGRKTEIGPDYKMQYRSHYGDLQFLHAMANSDKETASEVQTRIIDWMEFAYAIATGQIDPETTMNDVALPLASRYFAEQPGWTVNHLFGPKYTLGKATIPNVALGSMLHVVQDSYSDAHAERAFDSTRSCKVGRILEFHSYGSQSSHLHSASDTRASWKGNGSFTPDSNPVQASAQLLYYARSSADWATVVEPYLRNGVFCIGMDARVSSPGRYRAKDASESKL